jgi:hypothetical protein
MLKGTDSVGSFSSEYEYDYEISFHSNVAFIAVKQREKKFHKLNLLQTKIPIKRVNKS